MKSCRGKGGGRPRLPGALLLPEAGQVRGIPHADPRRPKHRHTTVDAHPALPNGALTPAIVAIQDTPTQPAVRVVERAGGRHAGECVEVEFGAGGEACRHGEGWRCLALHGVMKFSFTTFSSYVSVEDNLAEE